MMKEALKALYKIWAAAKLAHDMKSTSDMENLKTYFFGMMIATLLASSALAKPAMNSMCYLEDKQGAKVEGTNPQNMYEIASVSKIVTSFWALSKLGPEYSFTTRIFVDQTTADS